MKKTIYHLSNLLKNCNIKLVCYYCQNCKLMYENVREEIDFR